MGVDAKLSIIVLGESGVGKTSLLMRFTTKTFKEHHTNTMIDCLHKVVDVQGKQVKLELWDTAGQDRFRSIIRGYFRLADGVCLIYDVGDIITFNKLTSWLDELRCMNETAVSIIVGNKTDVPHRRSVDIKTVKAYAAEEQLPFVETSAKSGNNVDEIFQYLAEQILIKKGMLSEPVHPLHSITLNLEESPIRKISQQTSNSTGNKQTDLISTSKQEETPSSEEIPQQQINEAVKNAVNKQTSASKTFISYTETSLDEDDKENYVFYTGDETDSLPPIVKLPEETIKLHLEKKKEKKKNNNCC